MGILCLIAFIGLAEATEIENLRQHYIPEMPVEIVCEWIYKESSGNPNADNNRGVDSDRGLLQINSRYERYFCDEFSVCAKGYNLFDPSDNARIAFAFFDSLVDMYSGDYWNAFSHYNGGNDLRKGRKYADHLMDSWEREEYNNNLEILLSEFEESLKGAYIDDLVGDNCPLGYDLPPSYTCYVILRRES